jgi:WD40 repeat protein
MLATSGDDRTIVLRDLASAERRTLSGHTAVVKSLAWRADGRLLVSSGGGDGTLRLWSVASPGTPCRTVSLFPAGGWLHNVAFTPEGRHLATANPDGTVYILRLAAPGVVLPDAPSP